MEAHNDANAKTNVVFSRDARDALFEGMKVAADAVTCTLGPKGRTVLIQQPGMAPIVTKDGVTVSKSVKLKDPIRRMGAELIREAASQTNEVAGDGTTTATVLTHALVEGGLKLVNSGYAPSNIARGIEQAASMINEMLVSNCRKVETSDEISHVGTISANGDATVGNLIAQAMEKVGRDGIITVEDAKGMSTSLEVVEGMQFDRGYLSPYFVNDPEKMRALYNDAYVLVTDKKLSLMKDIVPVLEAVMRAQGSLLIIAEDVEGEALNGLVLNCVKKNLRVVAIKSPGYGQHKLDLLNDICTLTGATFVSSSTGTALEKVTLQQLGTCKRFVTDARSTTLVGTGSTKENVEKLVAELRGRLEDITLSDDDRTKLRVRIAKLASGVAVIRVGGSTEVEMVERKYRIEDALNATKAAAEEGIVPGGGQALCACALALASKVPDVDQEVKAGYDVVMRACRAPLRKIVKNAGLSPDVVLNELEKLWGSGSTLGYNAANGKYEDLMKVGVIDPVKVTRTALKNAVSVAVTFLNLDAVVYDEENND